MYVHTLFDVFSLADALADLVVVAFLGLAHESSVEARPEVVISQRILSSKIEEF